MTKQPKQSILNAVKDNWMQITAFCGLIGGLWGIYGTLPQRFDELSSAQDKLEEKVNTLTKTATETQKDVSYMRGFLKLPFKSEEITQL